MVTRFGMSRRFGLAGFATVESQYLEGRTSLNCSDRTAAEIDAEVVEILKESYEKALSMLRENRDVMDKLAEFLIEKETITGHQFMEIYCREKGIPMPEPKQHESISTAGGKTSSETTGETAEASAPAAAENSQETGSTPTEEQPGEAAESREAGTAPADAEEAQQSETSGKPEDDRPRGRFSNGTLD